MPGSTLSPVKLRACVGGKSVSLEKIYSPDESSESCAISARPVSTELKCSMLEKFLLYTAVRVLVLHQQCKPCAFGDAPFGNELPFKEGRDGRWLRTWDVSSVNSQCRANLF